VALAAAPSLFRKPGPPLVATLVYFLSWFAFLPTFIMRLSYVAETFYDRQPSASSHSTFLSSSPAPSSSSVNPFSFHLLAAPLSSEYEMGIRMAAYAMIVSSFLSSVIAPFVPLLLRHFHIGRIYATALVLSAAVSFFLFFIPDSLADPDHIWIVFVCYSVGIFVFLLFLVFLLSHPSRLAMGLYIV
jgi:hypothetical protein